MSMSSASAADVTTARKGSPMGATRDIYLAGGCFWGIDEYFSRMPGVTATQCGYANGPKGRPSYEDVCAGSGHVETVRVSYDPRQVGLDVLVRQLFKVIDPTSRNRQGNDCGVQYRTGVYYTDPADLPVLETAFERERQSLTAPLATELTPLASFFPAEEYHQDYLKKHPDGYCHVDLSSLREVGV
ncbi:peptide-methionine (S)-S-oxide reductase MsrA [Olsenella massiliensis]|uniref:peptide-methionine (S)-S-oxide reductase MsrA n=1 Tax=Olsenella massiliensis TaxID=1622075 RepID=UPI000A6A19F8|nr:peptide-methionine (S)-S-oxide reductase MsrA [Olsenella massiliensis]